MNGRPVEEASTTSGLPLGAEFGPEAAELGTRPRSALDARVLVVSLAAVLLAFVAALVAQGLDRLIRLVTNVSFHGRMSFAATSPEHTSLGWWLVLIPVGGGLIVGAMARWGSQAIRGHGIPEAMENVLFHGSRIPARLAFLKPISAAISIGTGGPFGAEGPIIATGGALGSLFGQLAKLAADERKTLLAAGAAAGMAATFGTPVSAVLLAIELLLFEYRPRSVIPVALAAAVAAGGRTLFVGFEPAFRIPALVESRLPALVGYAAVGALAGVLAVGVTRLVYAIEDGFERFPIHWMWWPAIGAIPVGIIGVLQPKTLGVGYSNIEGLVGGKFALGAAALLAVAKLASWSISLGSGTSGGTLAPLLTVGGGFGFVAGTLFSSVPGLHVDPRVAALVGMAATFAGASRAFLASVVFAFEATRDPAGLLPLLIGGAAAYLVASLLSRHSIMTEKLARRGARISGELESDPLELAGVAAFASAPVVTLDADETLESARRFLEGGGAPASHQGFPILGARGAIVGVLTRRDLSVPASDPSARLRELIRRNPVVIGPGASLRDAADLMVRAKVGRLPVVAEDGTLAGIVTRSDLLAAHEKRLLAS